MKTLIKITNIVNGKTFNQSFTDQAVLDAWLLEMEAQAANGDGWGWGPRTIDKVDEHGDAVTLPSELVPLIVSETADQWDLKAEYEIVTSDLTAEHDDYLQEMTDKLATEDQIRAAYDIVDGWTSLNDINITFLKKFFKYLIKYIVKNG